MKATTMQRAWLHVSEHGRYKDAIASYQKRFSAGAIRPEKPNRIAHDTRRAVIPRARQYAYIKPSRASNAQHRFGDLAAPRV
jgi:hypothetical protein